MALDLTDIEENVRALSNLITQLLLVVATLFSLEPDLVHSFAKLEEGLILDPARVIAEASLQEVKATN